jgi:N-formylglutamate amidohydrolase
MDIFTLQAGNSSPLIISSPHSGITVPDAIKDTFTPAGHDLCDTDWHVDKLYSDYVSANDATFIRANYSRYVIDLNRPPDNQALYPGQAKVPLCPDFTFREEPIYQDGLAPDEREIATRLKTYWQPYHDEISAQIARVKAIHGYAILYDAHSIRQHIPLLFDGDLPDLNLGTANGASCAPQVQNAAMAEIEKSAFSHVLNGRFIGGYITRHHGDPANGVHALQMEIVRSLYMDEEGYKYSPDRAAKLITCLNRVLNALTHHAGAGVAAKAIR